MGHKCTDVGNTCNSLDGPLINLWDKMIKVALKSWIWLDRSNPGNIVHRASYDLLSAAEVVSEIVGTF